MALHVEHEIHTRRFGRNLGLALLLVGFVALMMALTVVKITRGGVGPDRMEGIITHSNSIPDPDFAPKAGAQATQGAE